MFVESLRNRIRAMNALSGLAAPEHVRALVGLGGMTR